MAMKKKPKPLRPDPSGVKAEVRGRLSTRPVRQLGITGPLKKETIKNPNAPKGTGSGASAGSVRVLSKSESFLKREKAMRERSGRGVPMNTTPFKKSDTKSKPYNRTSPRNTVANASIPSAGGRYAMSFNEYKEYLRIVKSAQPKIEKPTKTTPKKKTEPKPKPKPKRKLFVGRGGGRGGSAGGGGLLPDYNR
jgi:hypothetical protein